MVLLVVEFIGFGKKRCSVPSSWVVWEFVLLSSAMLAKQVCEFFENSDALWVHFLSSIYCHNQSFLTTSVKGYVSYVWSSLLHGGLSTNLQSGELVMVKGLMFGGIIGNLRVFVCIISMML